MHHAADMAMNSWHVWAWLASPWATLYSAAHLSSDQNADSTEDHVSIQVSIAQR